MEVDPPRFAEPLDLLEAAAELLRRDAQRGLGLDVEVTRDVDDRELRTLRASVRSRSA